MSEILPFPPKGPTSRMILETARALLKKEAIIGFKKGTPSLGTIVETKQKQQTIVLMSADGSYEHLPVNKALYIKPVP